MEIAFPFMGRERFFALIIDFTIFKYISHKCVKNGAVVQHSYIMWQGGASDLFRKVLNMSGKYIINSFH